MVPPCGNLDTDSFFVSLLKTFFEALFRKSRYNSTVFSSLSTNKIYLIVATEEFLIRSNWTARTIERSDPGNLPSPYDILTIDGIYNDYHMNPKHWQNHSAYECLKKYSNPFDWRPGQLMLISSETWKEETVLFRWGLISSDATSGALLLRRRKGNGYEMWIYGVLQI